MHLQNHWDPMDFRRLAELYNVAHSHSHSHIICIPDMKMHTVNSCVFTSHSTNVKLSRSHGKCDMNKRNDKQSSKSNSEQQQQQHWTASETERPSLCVNIHTPKYKSCTFLNRFSPINIHTAGKLSYNAQTLHHWSNI